MGSRKRVASEKFLNGREVRVWRLSRGLTLAEAADWIGLTPQAFSNYEARGCSKMAALAMSAIDRGRPPYKPTDIDIASAEAADKRKDVDESRTTTSH